MKSKVVCTFDLQAMLAMALLTGADYDKQGASGVAATSAFPAVRKLLSARHQVCCTPCCRAASWSTEKPRTPQNLESQLTKSGPRTTPCSPSLQPQIPARACVRTAWRHCKMHGNSSGFCRATEALQDARRFFRRLFRRMQCTARCAAFVQAPAVPAGGARGGQCGGAAASRDPGAAGPSAAESLRRLPAVR